MLLKFTNTHTNILWKNIQEISHWSMFLIHKLMYAVGGEYIDFLFQNIGNFKTNSKLDIILH